MEVKLLNSDLKIDGISPGGPFHFSVHGMIDGCVIGDAVAMLGMLGMSLEAAKNMVLVQRGYAPAPPQTVLPELPESSTVGVQVQVKRGWLVLTDAGWAGLARNVTDTEVEIHRFSAGGFVTIPRVDVAAAMHVVLDEDESLDALASLGDGGYIHSWTRLWAHAAVRGIRQPGNKFVISRGDVAQATDEVPQPSSPAAAPTPVAQVTEIASTPLEPYTGKVVTYKLPGDDIRCGEVLAEDGEEVEVQDLSGKASVLVPRKSIIRSDDVCDIDGNVPKETIADFVETCQSRGRSPSWTHIICAIRALEPVNLVSTIEGRTVLDEDVMDSAVDLSRKVK